MEFFGLVALIGAVAGTISFAVIPGRFRGGAIVTALVGALGALAGAWIGRRVGLASGTDVAGFFAAVIGAGLLLAIWRIAAGRAAGA